MSDTREMLEEIGSLKTQLDIAEREIQEYKDRLAEAEAKVERMQEEVERAKEDKAIAEGFAHDNGLYDARNGVQEVFTDPEAEPESCGFVDGDKPFCRIKWYEDYGDPDVGIQSVAFWCLDDDQSGTELKELQQQGTRKDGLRRAAKIVKELRTSHQKDTGECEEECDFVAAWETAEQAIVKEAESE